MGNNNSLPPTISYQEATVKVGRGETGKVAEKFKRLTNTANLLKSDLELLFPDNHDFANLLFRAFCRYAESNQFKSFAEGISHQEFFRKYAMGVKGTEEERVLFCYLLFDEDGDCWLSREEFKRSLITVCNAAWEVQLPILYSFTSQHPLPPKKNDYFEIVENIAKKFLIHVQKPKMNFEQFRHFISTYPQIRMFIEFVLLSTFGGVEEMNDELKAFHAVTPPLFIGGESSILNNDDYPLLLRCWLPEPLCKYNWLKIYSTVANGFALGTFFNMLSAKPFESKSNATILIIKDEAEHIFGVFTPDLYRKNNDRFYGSEETFLFSLYPKIETFRCTGHDTNIIFSNLNSLSFGGSLQKFAISLDAEFYKGSSNSSKTFNNPQLSFAENFTCKSLEIWSFVDHENTNKLLGIHSDDEEDDDHFNSAFKKKKKGKTAVERYKDKVYVLDMIDKHYSANLEPPPTFDDDDKEKSKAASTVPSHGILPTTFHKPKPYEVD